MDFTFSVQRWRCLLGPRCDDYLCFRATDKKYDVTVSGSHTVQPSQKKKIRTR